MRPLFGRFSGFSAPFRFGSPFRIPSFRSGRATLAVKEVPMPLRDHFRPPVSLQATWDALHGMWPAEIVRQLRQRLPQGYVAAPTVHLGSQVEVPDYDEYAVRIYDAERGRQLVATIELVSPGNKDRPEKRNGFVGKCAALLQKGIAVSIVDAIALRQFNPYPELLQLLG